MRTSPLCFLKNFNSLVENLTDDLMPDVYSRKSVKLKDSNFLKQIPVSVMLLFFVGCFMCHCQQHLHVR